MESTGVPDKIHISEQTAKLIIDSGKVHWIYHRSDAVIAKGKGKLVTYFLHDNFVGSKSHSRSSASDNSMDGTMTDIDTRSEQPKDRTESLIEWASDLLGEAVAKAARVSSSPKSMSVRNLLSDPWKDANLTISNDIFKEMSADLDFKPIYDNSGENVVPVRSLTSRKVKDQIANFVRAIASLHEPNRFHNFEHACKFRCENIQDANLANAAHVTMSISKLLSRIVGQCAFDGSDSDIVIQLSCDPLLRTACIIAGLCHDLMHPGVPNTTLVKEEVSIAKKYNGRCVAERNSLDNAWGLLMEERFLEFRLALCPTKEDVLRFRKFLVHLILATDIMDGGLRDLYASRWSQVFENDTNMTLRPATQSTLVLQHLIQASDVSHTMQHWEIYIKWNERLFAEMCESYRSGRQAWDPVESWYDGEIMFFDNYIIPLAEKLRTCGVFGASSDEYLNYARQNRAEWESRGPGIVSEMLQKVESRAILSPPPSPEKRLLFKPPNVKDLKLLAEFTDSILDLDFSNNNDEEDSAFEGFEVEEVKK